jgi:hypothetical protein
MTDQPEQSQTLNLDELCQQLGRVVYEWSQLEMASGWLVWGPPPMFLKKWYFS